MSENDGKNEKQLIDYAGLPAYLQSLIIYRSQPHDLTWYRNPTLDSLMVWIMWMTASRGEIGYSWRANNCIDIEELFIDQIIDEHPNSRQLVMGILHSFIVAAHQVRFLPSCLKSLFNNHFFSSTLRFTVLTFILIYHSVAAQNLSIHSILGRRLSLRSYTIHTLSKFPHQWRPQLLCSTMFCE